MAILRLAVIISGAVFAAMIVWAIFTADFFASFDAITADPWGLVTLADLYLGFFLIAIVIALFEGSWRAIVWIVPLPFLGNVWAAIWLAVRLPALMRRLQGGGA